MSNTLKKAPAPAPAAPAPAAPAKAAFVSSRTSITGPRLGRVKYGNESDGTAAIMLFGPQGTGKTFAIVSLLLRGLKVLVVSTDIGGSGTSSVKLAMRRQGKADLLKNLVDIELNSYDEVQEFIDKPTTFFPEIYEFDPDFVAWDTFSGFQQIDIAEKIAETMPARKDGQVSEARETGLQFEQTDWGMIRNATVRTLSKFLSMHNTKTGKVWYKLVTAHEAIKQVQGQSGTFIEKREPMLQGAGGKIILGAFDLIIRTYVKKATGANGEEIDESGTAYWYAIDPGATSATKNRGVVFAGEDGVSRAAFPGDFGYVWEQFSAQSGIDSRVAKPEAPAAAENV
jgi:hypothetical protein